jgi:hypothetical protein
MTIARINRPGPFLTGLSTDTKPTLQSEGAVLGAEFFELDTGRRFLYTGAAWSLTQSPYPLQYFYRIPSQVHVVTANTVHWDVFNAHASLVMRVLSILQIPNVTTAVTGIVFDWLLERTTAVGTGGTALTAWLADLSQAALDALITARSKPTGGATESTDLRSYSLSSEETNAATIQVAAQGGLELVPEALRPANGGRGIVLRPTQGLRCVQVTGSIEGNTGWLIGFAVEPG